MSNKNNFENIKKIIQYFMSYLTKSKFDLNQLYPDAISFDINNKYNIRYLHTNDNILGDFYRFSIGNMPIKYTDFFDFTITFSYNKINNLLYINNYIMTSIFPELKIFKITSKENINIDTFLNDFGENIKNISTVLK